MRHNVRGRKFNRTASHRKMMFRNMVTELFRHEQIQTTTHKAKEARAIAERLITYAKAGDLNSRRMAARKLTDPQILKKLFDELGPRYADRPGGYTRVLKIDGPRRGDNADMSVLMLLGADEKCEPKPGRKFKSVEDKAAAGRVKAAPAAVVEPAAEDVPAAEAGEETTD
jgi:large subunit ribosomal protein L17